MTQTDAEFLVGYAAGAMLVIAGMSIPSIHRRWCVARVKIRSQLIEFWRARSDSNARPPGS